MLSLLPLPLFIHLGGRGWLAYTLSSILTKTAIHCSCNPARVKFFYVYTDTIGHVFSIVLALTYDNQAYKTRYAMIRYSGAYLLMYVASCKAVVRYGNTEAFIRNANEWQSKTFLRHFALLITDILVDFLLELIKE